MALCINSYKKDKHVHVKLKELVKSEKKDLEMLARVSSYTIEAERYSLLTARFQKTLNYSHNTQYRYASGKSQKKPWISNLLKIPFESLYFWRIATLLLLFCSWGLWKGPNHAGKLWVNQAVTVVPSHGNEWKQKRNERRGTVSRGSHKKAAMKWKVLCDTHSPPERRSGQCILSCTPTLQCSELHKILS